MNDMMGSTVKVWDPFVRVFQWGLVVNFAVVWFSTDTWDNFHETAGCVAAALFGFSLLWGLAGPKCARFSQFVRSPAFSAVYIGRMIGCKRVAAVSDVA
jgi:cytochrome b